MKLVRRIVQNAFVGICLLAINQQAFAQVGVGTKPEKGAEVFIDGSAKTLHKKWEYWNGPRLKATMPIKWTSVKDPVGPGNAIDCFDPSAAGGLYGAADIVTKKQFKDFRAHVEFYISAKGGNSGVYLQNRYEIQVLDGDTTSHGMGALINESRSPYEAYNGIGKWNSYDILFKAARFENGVLSEKPRVTLYFNGKKVHVDQAISQVWGGVNSGMDGGNDGGKGITDTPGGLKLQSEGHHVLYRNVWIKSVDLKDQGTDF